MTKVDQFESIFRSASKEVYAFEKVSLTSVLLVTDLDDHDANLYKEHIKKFLSVLDAADAVEWTVIGNEAYATVKDLLDQVEQHRPDLICTYRNLRSEAWKWPFSLGEFVDVLTQATTTPVLLMPHPEAERALTHALEDTNVVMAMTDHLAGDDQLVNFAVRLTETKGTLFLTHIEDEMAFERLLEIIGKIPSIDTESARETILAQLLKEPGDYITSCRPTLEENAPGLDVKQIVTLGRHLSEYEKLIEEHKVDLLVLNTKDEDQLAMHGLAYPLAVELRQIPLLLL